MAAPIRLFFAFFLLSIVGKGLGQCVLDDIKINQTDAGAVKWEHEYKVVIIKDCPCSAKNVRLKCPGFNSTDQQVDPKIIRNEDGDTCIVNDGQAIREPIHFAYYSKTQIKFVPLSFQAACS